MTKTIDCKGMACPLPVVNAKKALDAFTEAGELTVLVDNPTAVQNLTKLASSRQLEAANAQTRPEEYAVTIHVTAAPAGAQEADQGPGAVVAIGSNAMGSGDDALGKALMKAFIFALTNAQKLPEQIIFYNSGAFLPCEGSDSLEDLENLEKAGVKITACGTCLNHYGLTDKLRVGTVSNMYDIVETLTSAGSVIRP